MRRVAVDTNAAIDYLRPDRTPPPPIAAAPEIVLPLPVVGELFGGAFGSNRIAENVAAVENLMALWIVLAPDRETARVYGRLRAQTDLTAPLSTRRRNDLWMAALAVQYDLPLVTNDAAFRVIPGVRVIHW